MAQGDSIVGICNAGLIALGVDPITSLTDPSKAAILCAAKYDQTRRELLRSAPWACAKKLAQLAASVTAPAFKWGNAYPVPADFIRPWEIDNDGDQDNATWEIVDGMILTNEGAPLLFEYIYDLQDPTRFDALFSKTLALAVAEAVCDALTGSDGLMQRVQSRLGQSLAMGQLVDSQSDGPQELDDDVWLRSRR